MTDTYIAKLGYRVDTKELKKGDKALEDLTKSGKLVEKQNDKVEQSFDDVSKSIVSLAASQSKGEKQTGRMVDALDDMRISTSKTNEITEILTTTISESRKDSLALSKTTESLSDEVNKLGISEDKLKKKTRDATKEVKKSDKSLTSLAKSSKKTEASTTKLNKAFKDVRGPVDDASQAFKNFAFISGGAALTAIAAFTYHLGDAERQLRTSALMANMSTGDFEKLTFVYKQFGMTVDQTSDIFKDSREKIGQWLTDQTGGFEDFGNVMGMTTEQLTAYAKEVEGLSGQQLLQRVVSDMEDAGISASQMSFALEGLASEATRMIPALTDNGKAVRDLEKDYDSFNAALALDDKEIEQYARLNKEFDLLFDTIGNRATKVMAPFAEILSEMARDVTEMITGGSLETQLAVASGNVEDIDKKLTGLKAKLESQQSTDTSNMSSVFAFSALNDQIDKTNSQIVELTKSRSEYADEMERLQKLIDSTAKASVSNSPMQAVNKVDSSAKNRRSHKDKSDVFTDLISGTDTVDLFALNKSKEYDKWLDSVVESTVTASEKIQREIEKIQDAVSSGNLDKATGDLAISNLESQLPNPFEEFTSGAIDALTAVQSLSEQGSKEWQELGATINTVNAGMDIATAVGNASMGNIVGAVTSSIAALESVSMAFGGDDNADLYLERIESQFLDPLGKKSDSISVATETTASATEKLVGINTAMLESMQKLQVDIGNAAAMIAGDTRGIQYSGGPDTFDSASLGLGTMAATAIFGPLGFALDGMFDSVINSLVGGDSKVVGQGIRIEGGNITDLADAVNAYAYQDVSVKKNMFDDYDTYRDYQDLGSEAETQIALVFDSLITAVATGADALGISEAEINEAINSFEVATTDIELKDLTPEEQAAELESYFSDIFNDLSSAVIPWIEDFQQAGEELGETMGRVATEVAVFDVLVRDLGVSMSSQDLDPQAYAEAADNLTMLTGGVEEFANKTSSFINNFASDATKIDIYANALDESLSEVGLSLPATSDAMWELMSSLDASTEEGQKQIATLLNVQDTAAAYYKLLEQSSSSYRDAIDSMYGVSDAVAQMSLDAALAAARMGDFSLAEDLDLNAVQPSSSDFSTQAEFDIAQAETAAKLEELAQLTEGSVTVDEQQLDTLKQIEENTKTQTDNSNQIEAMNNQIKELANIQEGQARNIALCEDYLDTIANGSISVRVEA